MNSITSSSSSPIKSIQSIVSLIETAEPTKVENTTGDYCLVSIKSSAKYDDEGISGINSNCIVNKLRVRGKIAVKRSSQDNKMLFMGNCGYFYLNGTKNIVG